MELISIVIPVYNRKDIVSKSVDSALIQNYPNFEIIIVDNNSTDGTFEFLNEKYGGEPKIKLFQNDTNVGPVKNWIRGIEEAKGKYIKLLFSDDWIESNYLLSISKFFNEDEVSLFYTPAIIHSEERSVSFYKTYKKNKLIPSNKFISNLLLGYRTPVSPGCALFTKELLLESLNIVINKKNHDQFLMYGAGIDMYCYLYSALNNKYVYYISDSFAHFLSHKGSFTTSNSLRSLYKTTKLYFINRKIKIPRRYIYKLIVWFELDRILVQLSNRI
ncbi:MAG: hypothetical protein PWP52_377 [Bacteroidales bacterium]|nr:hypothetical protein [Bacteroidales bacterium]